MHRGHAGGLQLVAGDRLEVEHRAVMDGVGELCERLVDLGSATTIGRQSAVSTTSPTPPIAVTWPSASGVWTGPLGGDCVALTTRTWEP